MILQNQISWCIRRALCIKAQYQLKLLIDIAEISDHRCKRYQVMFRDIHERRFAKFNDWYIESVFRADGDWLTSPSAAFGQWQDYFLDYFSDPRHVAEDERWVALELDRRMWPDEIE